MSEKELLKLADDLIELSNYCNTITSGNLSHRICNLRHALINTADYIKTKIKNS